MKSNPATRAVVRANFLIRCFSCFSIGLLLAFTGVAETLDQQALTKQKRGDLDGALNDFTQAIQKNPKDSIGFSGRANVKRTQMPIRPFF